MAVKLCLVPGSRCAVTPDIHQPLDAVKGCTLSVLWRGTAGRPADPTAAERVLLLDQSLIWGNFTAAANEAIRHYIINWALSK
jgi:hypothetical protein